MDSRTSALLGRVRRYALPNPLRGDIAGVILRQRGAIRLGPNRKWLPFEAEQRIGARQLRFAWDARVRMFPVVPVRVHDAYEDGRGRLDVRLLRIPLTRASGPEVDEGELLRYLAELPWCPPAFDHPGLDWSAPDDHTLTVAPRDRPHSRVTFEVDPDGRITRATAQRPRQAGKTYVRSPWGGVFSDYHDFNDMRLPRLGEGCWYLPEGAFTYFRGEILSVEPLAS
jgi:hypothetical protein